MKYLSSAVTSFSKETKFINEKSIKFANIFGIISYTAVIVILGLYFLITYPGYVNNGDPSEFLEWY